MGMTKNLDYEAMKKSNEIFKDYTKDIKEMENSINKSLGVLQSDGIFACMLYILSNQGKCDDKKTYTSNAFDNIRITLISSLKTLDFVDFEDYCQEDNIKERIPEFLNKFSENICSDLDKIIKVKSFWEKILVYARHGASARGN